MGGCSCKWSEDFHHTRSSKNNTQPEIVQLDGHFCEGGTIEGCWHTANPNSNVFLTWNGEPMVSSQINKAIKSVWKKAQVDGNPSSTLPRKSAVSRVHTASDSNEARGNLADLMAHILQTANKYYRLQEKSKSSVQASKQLRSIMREQSDHPDQTAKRNSTSVSPSPSASEAVVPKTSRGSWNEDKEALIKTVFKDEIEHKAITLATVKTKISNHPQLREEDPKRVLDKVRAQWRFSKSPLQNLNAFHLKWKH